MCIGLPFYPFAGLDMNCLRARREKKRQDDSLEHVLRQPVEDPTEVEIEGAHLVPEADACQGAHLVPEADACQQISRAEWEKLISQAKPMFLNNPQK